MNKRQKLVQEQFINNEEAVIRALKRTYGKALNDINAKTKALQEQINGLQGFIDAAKDDESRATLLSMQQSKVYQKQYQDALKKQIGSILDNMQVEEFTTVSDYLQKCYEDGFIGTMYDLQGQGISLCFPIDQEAVVRAVQTDAQLTTKKRYDDGTGKKVSLYEKLGEDVASLKKKIASEVSRGISTGASYVQIAQNLSAVSKAGLNNSIRIARTEGHRVQVQSAMDACYKAKDMGADIVKQWDSALDKRTRPSHQRVDGEVRELDEPFSNGLMYPGDPAGGAAEVVNCRCALLERARWAVEDEEELETLKKRAEYYGIDKSDNFEDFKKKYLKAAEEIKAKAEPKTQATTADVNASGSKMLSEAYERHRIKNGLTSVSYDDLGDSADNIVFANYGKMSVESATAFNDTIFELANEYDTPLQRIRTMTKNEFLGNGSSFAFVTHDYTVDSAELVINPAKCKEIAELADRIKDLSKRGYCVKISDDVAGRYVATHEFAHTLINFDQPLKKSTNWLGADYGKIKKARKEINDVYESYMSEVEKLTKAKKNAEFMAMMEVTDENWKAASEATKALNAVKLSDYSLQNADEFMAESFANEKIGVSSNPYSKAVMDILNKYFKG